MANPYRNKVVLADDTVIMDISDSTVTPSSLLEGVTAYAASGERITGTYVGLPSYTSADENKVLQIVNGNPTWSTWPWLVTDGQIYDLFR